MAEQKLPAVPQQHRLLILYGTQTGTAEDVALCFARQSACRGFKPSLQTMDEYDRQHLPSERLVCFVASTTGDAEAPETMTSFWRFLLRRNLPRGVLSQVKFAVFGLGDSSYPKYNAVARRLEVRLKQLGAQEVCTIGLGDDQSEIGVHGDFDNWSSKLWKAVLALYPIPSGCAIDDTPKLEPPVSLRWTSADPDRPSADEAFYSRPSRDCYASASVLRAKLLRNERVTAAGWEQDVRHLELQLPQPFPAYQAGDVAVVYPQNSFGPIKQTGDRAGADALITTLGYKPEQLFEGVEGLPSPCSVRQLFTTCLDVHGIPKRFFFEQLSFFAKPRDDSAEAAEEAEEQQEKLVEMSRMEGADLYQSYVVRAKRTYVEVLLDFKSARPPIPHLIALIPKLKPRHYSIASSHLFHKDKLQLVIALVSYRTRYGREKEGVCSAWLRKLSVGSIVPLWLRRGTIRLNPTRGRGPEWWRPMLCIGPGTGVAPMRALLYRRAALLKAWTAGRGPGPETGGAGDASLFFGCRHQAQDFFYKDEWLALVAGGQLNRLYAAFSRDSDSIVHGRPVSVPDPKAIAASAATEPPAEVKKKKKKKKVYVQHLIAEHSAHIWAALSPAAGGFCYVAGSAQSKMPSDVRDAILKVFEREGKLSTDEARKYFRSLELTRRYQCEAWS